MADCVKVFLAGAYSVSSDLEPGKISSVCCEDKLVWLESDSVSATDIKPVDSLMIESCHCFVSPE